MSRGVTILKRTGWLFTQWGRWTSARSCSTITQRQGQSPCSITQGFSGYLETDGYQGYNNLPDIKRCSCWAHETLLHRCHTEREYDYSLPAVQECSSAPSCLIVRRDTQKQKHTAEIRENSSVLKGSRYWMHSGIGWINSTQTKEPVFGEKAVNYASKSERHPDDLPRRRTLQSFK